MAKLAGNSSCNFRGHVSLHLCSLKLLKLITFTLSVIQLSWTFCNNILFFLYFNLNVRVVSSVQYLFNCLDIS